MVALKDTKYGRNPKELELEFDEEMCHDDIVSWLVLDKSLFPEQVCPGTSRSNVGSENKEVRTDFTILYSSEKVCTLVSVSGTHYIITGNAEVIQKLEQYAQNKIDLSDFIQ